MTLSEFSRNMYDQVMIIAENEMNRADLEEAFSAVMFEYLEEAGETENSVVCTYRAIGVQLNGYSVSDDGAQVDLFVSIFENSAEPQTVRAAEIDAAMKRGVQLYRKAVNNLYESLDRETDAYNFASRLYSLKDAIEKVRIIIISNGLIKNLSLSNIMLGTVEVSFSIWDIDRLYRCVHSGRLRETVTVDFRELCGTGLACIGAENSGDYCTYLAIVPGDVLAAVYDTYGTRLLERNVRAFLQVKGAVNKGIRDTIKNEPQMFLAYNNGISVTAESVELGRTDSGHQMIVGIHDMQIVNGGQTTASIFNTGRREKVDLSHVFVQMKLTVIADAARMDEIVPLISAYANTQNKIQIADFSSNGPFHRSIEELSRTVWTPLPETGEKQSKWFYERARGQFADMRAREHTKAEIRKFDEEYPKAQLFAKTDLAKYENTWDQLPHHVSKGAQKNFKEFMMRLTARGKFTPDQRYFQNLVAKAILFKRAERLVDEQKFGGYRANIVTYTLSWISHHTSQRINLDEIWKQQSLPTALESAIVTVSHCAHAHIINAPNGANIGEWCKNQKCWTTFQGVSIQMAPELEESLISVEKTPTTYSAVQNSTGINQVTESESEVIKEAKYVPSVTWFALSKWAKETNNFQTWQRSLIYSLGKIAGRNGEPSYKQSVQGMKVLQEALEKGFRA